MQYYPGIYRISLNHSHLSLKFPNFNVGYDNSCPRFPENIEKDFSHIIPEEEKIVKVCLRQGKEGLISRSR